jgi:hypothetical protein
VTGTEAILGGVRAPWEAPDSPLPAIWANGSLRLADFGGLASFLAKSAASNPDLDERLKGLLGAIEADA